MWLRGSDLPVIVGWVYSSQGAEIPGALLFMKTEGLTFETAAQSGGVLAWAQELMGRRVGGGGTGEGQMLLLVF